MKTIRNRVFETNSSSCHSITLMSIDKWEDFKKGNLYIKSNRFSEIEEHKLVIDIINKENEDEYFEKIEKLFKQYDDELSTYVDYYQLATKSRYLNTSNNELEIKTFNLLKGNWSIELFKKLINSINTDTIFKLDEPIIVDYGRYYNDDKDHKYSYSTITVGNCWEILSYVKEFSDGEIDNFMVYDYYWKENTNVKIFDERGSNNSVVIIERDVEC